MERSSLIKESKGLLNKTFIIWLLMWTRAPKMLGGIGTCGRILCCNNFLGEFAPVSIKMAKEQRLSLNPTKISGICGRLMCCLKYESEMYDCKKPEGAKNGKNGTRIEGIDPGIDS
jgi:hypothetical protein